MFDVKEPLLRYVKINTQSDEYSETTPSTEGQWDLLHLLEKELQELGLETSLDDKGYLFGKLASNVDHEVKTLGLLAHVDTAPDYSGDGVNPIITKYEGGDLVINKEENVIMTLEDFPNLEKYKGETLIHTDGSTLLGADNKAGIAEIMAALKFLKEHPEKPHGAIHVAFTPDEEIGRGPHHFDVEKFGADIAYTIDGGEVGEIQYENFNAATAIVTVHGRNVHPGHAKDKMINSIPMAMEFAQAMPQDEVPEKTEMYEGFIHLNDFKGTVEESKLYFIIRDHDLEKFEAKKTCIRNTVEDFNELYKGAFELHLEDSYFNMREKILPVMEVVDFAKEAMENLGITPIVDPVRGGTDGAQLSYMGLPCPNLFTGGENFHGKFEFISVEAMDKAVAVILEIIDIFSNKNQENMN